MQTNQSVITQAIHLFCDMPCNLEILGMVTPAPRALSYAFVRTFFLSKSHHYGSLYVTLCFVLCRLYFGVLTFYFRILSFLFMCSVYDVVHFKRRNSRGETRYRRKDRRKTKL